MCCDPERSPLLAAIEDSLVEIRCSLDSVDSESLDRALRRIEEIGGVIGRLQVGCCAPPRLPLYAEALSHLNMIQLEVDRERGRHVH
jgi:hypothetical protein